MTAVTDHQVTLLAEQFRIDGLIDDAKLLEVARIQDFGHCISDTAALGLYTTVGRPSSMRR